MAVCGECGGKGRHLDGCPAADSKKDRSKKHGDDAPVIAAHGSDWSGQLFDDSDGNAQYLWRCTVCGASGGVSPTKPAGQWHDATEAPKKKRR